MALQGVVLDIILSTLITCLNSPVRDVDSLGLFLKVDFIPIQYMWLSLELWCIAVGDRNAPSYHC